MKSFNLKVFKTAGKHDHTNQCLVEHHKDPKNEITQGQLEDYRAGENNSLTEKQLEQKRTGGAQKTTEKNLNDSKSKFANKYRNPDAYNGNVGKLEKKRLASNPVEDEKYEAASETPKQFRWWEDVKSPDGLKVAGRKAIKKAQTDTLLDDSPDVDLDDFLPEESPFKFDEAKIAEEIAEEADREIRQMEDIDRDLTVLKWKTFANEEKPQLNAVYAILSFEPDAFGSDEMVKEAALDKIMAMDDFFDGKISVDDFYEVKREGDMGTVKFRVVGEEFMPFTVGKGEEDFSEPERVLEESEDFGEEGVKEIGYNEVNVGGTPMAIGRVSVRKEDAKVDRDRAIGLAIDYINLKRPRIEVTKESLDLTDLDEKGEIGYMVGVIPAGEDFPIEIE